MCLFFVEVHCLCQNMTQVNMHFWKLKIPFPNVQMYHTQLIQGIKSLCKWHWHILLLFSLAPRRSIPAHTTWREISWRHRMHTTRPHSVTSRHFAASRVEWAGGERLGTRLVAFILRRENARKTDDVRDRSRVHVPKSCLFTPRALYFRRW